MGRKDLTIHVGGGAVEPRADDADLMPYAGTGQHSAAPDYLAVRPHTQGWGQAKWSMIITPYRATLHFRLWITLTWWRVVIMALLVICLVVLVKVLL